MSDAVTAAATVLAFDELRGAARPQLGRSDWMVVDRARIDLFADAIEDHQHVSAPRIDTRPGRRTQVRRPGSGDTGYLASAPASIGSATPVM